MNRLFLLCTMLGSVVPLVAQTKGAPPTACTSSNYNAAYNDTTNNVAYLCTSAGWIAGIGIGAPTVGCSAQNYGRTYTDVQANAQYVCGGSGWTLSSSGGGPFLPLAGGTLTGTLNAPTVVATSAVVGPIQDKGGAVFNISAYGAATGNVDNTTAITATVSALNAAGSGILQFPAGNFASSTCNFSITVPALVEGAGSGMNDSQTTMGSALTCASASNPAFTFSGNIGKVRDIAIYNSASTPTAAGIVVSGSSVHQKISLDNVYIWGFYDGIQENGAYWEVGGGSQFTNNVRAGIYIQNTNTGDEGDWNVDHSSCNGGPKTNISTTPGSSSCVYIVSAGGGKITSIKSNATLTHGIYLNCAACSTNQLLITAADIENTTNSPIYLTSSPSTYLDVVLTGSFLSGPNGYPDIYESGVEVLVSGNKLDSYGSNSVAIQCQDTSGKIGPNLINGGAFTSIAGNGCSAVNWAGDLLTSSPGVRSSTWYVGCAFSGCGNGETLNFIESNGIASVASSWTGNGLTFTPPRNLAGKGFVFQNNGNTQNQFYIDSMNGNVYSKNQVIDDGNGNATFLGNFTLKGGTHTVGCTTAGCSGSASINFNMNSGGTGYSNSIQSSYAGNGLTFTLPRNLTGKGYVFQSNGSAATLAYMDSVSGALELPVAGSALILKSAAGVCYPVTVPNGGGSLTVGSSVTCPY